ncbi:MAG: DUF370 domain-containing protein [Alicyclobacillus sp.]|nr:DUF370 domain-containing protein [Alicyclobacillus sp.]
MFIHLGGDTVVSTRDVIGIFDIQTQSSGLTQSFLQYAQDRNAIAVVDHDEIKSFVVTPNKVFFSPISSGTLKRRAQIFESGFKLDIE